MISFRCIKCFYSIRLYRFRFHFKIGGKKGKNEAYHYVNIIFIYLKLYYFKGIFRVNRDLWSFTEYLKILRVLNCQCFSTANEGIYN